MGQRGSPEQQYNNNKKNTHKKKTGGGSAGKELIQEAFRALLLLMGKNKENNLTLHVTCWKTPDKTTLMFPVFWKYQCCVDYHRCHLTLLPLTSRMSHHLALDTWWRALRPFSPVGASPVPIFSDSPEEVTLVHWRCELVFFSSSIFFGENNYI